MPLAFPSCIYKSRFPVFRMQQIPSSAVLEAHPSIRNPHRTRHISVTFRVSTSTSLLNHCITPSCTKTPNEACISFFIIKVVPPTKFGCGSLTASPVKLESEYYSKAYLVGFESVRDQVSKQRTRIRPDEEFLKGVMRNYCYTKC